MAHNRVPVVAIDADGNRVKFPSMTAAAKTIGVGIAQIWEAVNFGHPATEMTGTLADTTEQSAAEVLQRYIDAYDMAIAALREQPQWISVEEALPEPGQMVLVYCRSQMYKKHITVSTYTADYSYTRRCYWSRRIRNVTHWMPLPEPPKEEV